MICSQLENGFIGGNLKKKIRLSRADMLWRFTECHLTGLVENLDFASIYQELTD